MMTEFAAWVLLFCGVACFVGGAGFAEEVVRGRHELTHVRLRIYTCIGVAGIGLLFCWISLVDGFLV